MGELARLTGLSKQGASRTLGDLEKLGLVEKAAGDADARRKPATLTRPGLAFEARVSERLRALIARAYRTGGLDGVAGARRILAAWPARASTSAARRTSSAMAPADSAHLLVVDDDDRIRDLLKAFLSRAGFRVTAAADARAARRMLEAFDVDLMVLDVMMPGETGFELTGWLRAQPGRKGAPPCCC